MQETGPFLTIFTVMANFSMHQLFYINHLDQTHVLTFFALQGAMMYFGTQFEAMIRNGFNNKAKGKEENEDWGKRELNIICCLFDVYKDSKTFNQSNGDLPIKLGDLIKKLRNLICAVLYFGIIVYHVLH